MATTTGTKKRGRGTRKAPPPPQVAAQMRRQMDRYRAARRQNAAETAEDYVELIDDLIRVHGEARSVELASRLGVSHVTVAKTVQRLQRAGLVRAEPYRSVFLTPVGKRLAVECRSRHQAVVEFLKVLGVEPATAERDAEGIEHHVSEATLRAMTAFVREKR